MSLRSVVRDRNFILKLFIVGTLTFASVQRLLSSKNSISSYVNKHFFGPRTDSKRNMSFEAEKQKYLSMSPAEKRQLYKAAPTTVDQILSWPDYWKQNKASIGEFALENVEKVKKELASKVSIWEGDITKLEVDAIVNAANSKLYVGGGVDGAIHRAAGGFLEQECSTLGGCPVGQAKLTGGYKLPAKYVIQTVGPQGEIPEKLQQCYENSLLLAKENGLRSIAFPCISTGIYGYPQKAAANVALTTVKKFLLANPNSMNRVIFCLFLKTDKDIYEELLQKYFAFE